MDDNLYTFEYQPGAIHHGAGSVSGLEAALGRRDLSRALVVTDSTLAGISEVMDPIEDGLGDRLAGIFDGVTPEKYLKTAYDGAKRVRNEDIDALVPIGGGSSLDISKQISILAGHDRPLEDVANDYLERGTVMLPDEDVSLLDGFAVPTTLPGAELSQVAGVKLSLHPEDHAKSDIPSVGVSDRRLMPTAVFHDLKLFATTPAPILARSALNGFDKGIEMLYTRYHNPMTDGTAIRGVRLLREGLPAIVADSTNEDALSQVVQGIAAAQYGLSTPNEYCASVIHSFGHAIARNYETQQGVAHAIAAPHVLRYLFEQVDGRRELLAEALDVRNRTDGDRETGEAVVDSVAELRDELDLPSRLRTVEGVRREHFPDLAQAVVEDPFMEAGPRKLDATRSDIETVFDAMW